METQVEVWENKKHWEREPLGKCFNSFSKFSQTFISLSIKQLDWDQDCYHAIVLAKKLAAINLIIIFVLV